MSYNVNVTKAFVSKGYKKKPAIWESEDGTLMRFRTSYNFYDKNAEDGKFWDNDRVIVSGYLCEKIRNMGLKEGSFINYGGERVLESIPDEETGEIKRMFVIRLAWIEFAGSGKKADDDDDDSDELDDEEEDEEEEEVKPKAKKTAQAKATASKNTVKPTAKKGVESSKNNKGFSTFGGTRASTFY